MKYDIYTIISILQTSRFKDKDKDKDVYYQQNLGQALSELKQKAVL